MSRETAQHSEFGEGESRAPIPLRTMRDVQVELACVYNQARAGVLPMKDATGLAHILQCVTKTIELRASDEVLDRLEALERKTNS